MTAYRLAIVDDEPSIRRGLSLLPWADMGYEIVGLFPDGRDAIAYMENSSVDVVLTDICMTHVSGIALAEWVCAHRPGVRLVILSGYSEFQYAKAAIRYQAVRYLLKPTDPDELSGVFREIKHSLDAQEQLLRIQQLMTQVQSEQESEQETARKVLSHMDDQRYADRMIDKLVTFLDAPGHGGASLTEIADALGISASHLSRLFKQRAGENFSTYIIRHRISAAQKLLLETDGRVQDIGKAVGYWDIRHFIKIFNSQTGMSPSEYRKKLR